LAGVPFGVKDLENCAGMPTSYGSLLFEGRPPVAQDSIHVRRLRAAGAVPVGKTATPEFGTVCFTSTRAWGTTANPWDLDRTPGGSSGGSAAAVAAGLVPFCTASDGGGSTRIPAAFSGLVRFKASLRRPRPGRGGGARACRPSDHAHRSGADVAVVRRRRPVDGPRGGHVPGAGRRPGPSQPSRLRRHRRPRHASVRPHRAAASPAGA